MSPAVERELEKFDRMIKDLGKQSHHTPQDYPKAVRMFVHLFQDGERPHPDDVKHWALSHGWSQEHARDLGEMCDVVMYTMKELGHI